MTQPNEAMPQAPAQFSFPMLPEMYTDAIPPRLPLMQFNGSFVGNFFHNLKLNQLQLASEREAQIAENHARKSKANLELLSDFMTFQARVFDQFREYEFKEKERQLRLSILENEKDEGKLKNQNLYFETRTSEMEFRKRDKEFEEMYGAKPA